MDNIDETFTAIAIITLGMAIISSLFSDSMSMFFLILLTCTTIAFLIKNVYEYIVSKRIVYVVYNEALHHDSSYHEMIEVCKNRKTAEAVVAQCAKEIYAVLESGGFGDDFKEYSISTSFRKYDYAIVGAGDYFEAWEIVEMKLI